VNGAGSLEDEKIAAWLKKNRVTTIYGSLRFDGPFNHGDAAQLVQAGAEQGVEGDLADRVRRAWGQAESRPEQHASRSVLSSPRFAWGGARAAGGGVKAHDPSVAV